MNPKKQKEKDRRRARKLAAEAWEAVNAGNLDLAEKIIRRAVAAQVDNPVLWNDQGVVLNLREKEAEACESFRAAISLAPSYAEPYAHLAAIRLRQGFRREALSLQAQAVKLDPKNAGFAERLEAYRVIAGEGDPQSDRPSEDHTGASNPQDALSAHSDDALEWLERLEDLDWHRLGNQLTRDGCAVIARLVDAPTCEQLRGMFDDDALFAKTVVMDRPEFGLGVYRYFRPPIPDVVERLRRAVYPHLAPVANEWQRLLGEAESYPPTWEEFRDHCRLAGQTSPTPILLKYGPGGFNALHRDVRGSVFFPIQMAVVLSPQADPSHADEGFEGGEFLFCDVPEGGKARRREIAAGLGDAVLFCTRDRLVRIGGAYGWQPVKHGVAPITAGTRFVLGVPFHEYR